MHAPKLPSFIKNVRTNPKQFHFRSRHYDPKKEALEKRKREIEAELGLNNSDQLPLPPVVRIAGKKYKKSNIRASKRQSNIRLIVILAVLCGLAYWLYMYLGRIVIN